MVTFFYDCILARLIDKLVRGVKAVWGQLKSYALGWKICGLKKWSAAQTISLAHRSAHNIDDSNQTSSVCMSGVCLVLCFSALCLYVRWI